MAPALPAPDFPVAATSTSLRQKEGRDAGGDQTDRVAHQACKHRQLIILHQNPLGYLLEGDVCQDGLILLSPI